MLAVVLKIKKKQQKNSRMQQLPYFISLHTAAFFLNAMWGQHFELLEDPGDGDSAQNNSPWV